jgi:hypothetical protein
MPINKVNANVVIAFDETSISYMKALLATESGSHSGATKIMIDDLLDQLHRQVRVTFGEALWNSL